MTESTTTIQIQLHKGRPAPVVAKQHDRASRFLQAQLLDGETPLDLSPVSKALLLVKKRDGNQVLGGGEIVDAVSGKLRFPLTGQMLALAGMAECEILLYGDGGLLSTVPFPLAVVAAVRDEEAVESSSEYAALTDTMLECRALIGRVEELLESLEDREPPATGPDAGGDALLAAHNESGDAHPDIRREMERAAEICYTKAETESLLADHGGDPEAHGDIRAAVTAIQAGVLDRESAQGMLAAHDGDREAHGGLRGEMALALSGCCSVEALEGKFQEAAAEAARQVVGHNGSGAAHEDIRAGVARLEESIYTREETEILLVAHGEDAAAHRDLREALAEKADREAVNAALEAKAALSYVDSGLAQKAALSYVDNGLAQKAGSGDVTAAVAAHGADSAAHGDIRSALAAKAGTAAVENALAAKAGKAVSRTVTLTAGGWTGGGPYRQTAAVEGMTPGALWGFDVDRAATSEQALAFGAAFLRDGGEGVNAVTFVAEQKVPGVNLPVRIVIWG